jgi:hypothetical protein
LSPFTVAVKGSELQPFETGTTSVCPDRIIGFLVFEFLAFNVANRFTLFFSSSNVRNDVAPSFFKISSQ